MGVPGVGYNRSKSRDDRTIYFHFLLHELAIPRGDSTVKKLFAVKLAV